MQISGFYLAISRQEPKNFQIARIATTFCDRFARTYHMQKGESIPLAVELGWQMMGYFVSFAMLLSQFSGVCKVSIFLQLNYSILPGHSSPCVAVHVLWFFFVERHMSSGYFYSGISPASHNTHLYGMNV